MTLLGSFYAALIVLLASAVVSLLLARHDAAAHRVASIGGVIGSALALTTGVGTLIKQHVLSASAHTSFPLLHIVIHIDGLAALFICIIASVSLIVSIYGQGYMKQYYGKYNVGAFGFFLNMFMLSMLLVVTAYSGLYFVFVWELMALSSLFLVLFEHREPATTKAGLIYFVMTHISTMFLLVGFLLLYRATGSFDFATIRAASASLHPHTRNIALLCFLIGFGIKAGVMPLHIWLPKAHSATPSHVSALMSGVMLKMGVFMLFRMFLDILPQPVAWLGYTVLVIGMVSSIFGILYAHSEQDSKRLLAYSSIENIGIIMLGLGASLIFLRIHQPGLALLAAIASLFHTVNHATFKPLLFLGAGSVYAATHTRNIEKYGGLIKRMPLTAVCFLIGVLAISGLPPLNGFASEWATYMSLFSGIGPNVLTSAMLMLAAGALALTSGLAIACFVRLYGITFLARPRSTESEKAVEASSFMTTGMVMLVACCVLLGLGSGVVLVPLRSVLQSLSSFSGVVSPITASKYGTVHIGQAAFFNLPLIAGCLCAVLLVGAIIVFLTSRRQQVRYAGVWASGFQAPPTPRTEITATGFSRSFITVYRRLFQPTRQVDTETVGHLRYYTRSSTIHLGVTDAFDKYLYRFFHPLFNRFSKQTQRIQSGNLSLYLFYIFGLLLLLMAWVRWQ